ncbi:uncharacterized protein (TIGR00743 family) [Bisgaardia hudsonensis]|uniref:Uncharacterized protein (TIGR00743 family) n=1 Tax=Bisgaardia hudsonensis TaxID=109472 RepID=A0A4V2SJ11_9PAST|nr:YfcZ/YiiS family protein [Bisgaardia hudsonensis]QLB12284.1 hypothetical protein A6A11_00950 [Bisgaardia hudsonensis]TCP12328.1 uncharacterized protein (TIGR00743 family) [Bisgaardia hudsonensis]
MTKETELQCKAEEVQACCCVDVGTVIDNTDLTVDFSQNYQTEEQAKEALAYLTQKAKNAASEPCEIVSHISQVDNEYNLKASFTFSCQAETMIFQLSTR